MCSHWRVEWNWRLRCRRKSQKWLMCMVQTLCLFLDLISEGYFGISKQYLVDCVVNVKVCSDYGNFNGYYINVGGALKSKRWTGIRWHPLSVKWCLNLSRVSPKAYEIMQDSGYQLPTRCTLNDYTYWISVKPGFQNEGDDFLVKEAKVEELDLST